MMLDTPVGEQKVWEQVDEGRGTYIECLQCGLLQDLADQENGMADRFLP